MVSLGAAIAQIHKPERGQQKIDRQALVLRHRVINTGFDSLSAVSVGNGEFAFTVDATGLQTFPERYERGIPLGTQAQWGWHSFPNPQDYRVEEVYREYAAQGRKIPYTYAFSGESREAKASNWLRENPHRLHLGLIGFALRHADGSTVSFSEIKKIRQVLNPWTGEISSHFEVDGQSVDVLTICHPQQDAVAVQIRSSLLTRGQLAVRLRFPYGSGDWESSCDWNSPDKHRTQVHALAKNRALFTRQLDTTRYLADLHWQGAATLQEREAHTFELKPTGLGTTLAFTCRFSTRPAAAPALTWATTQVANRAAWQRFWRKGGVVDFSGSSDRRATELERRIVLSQYLTRIQCAGSIPPQETGLTTNSWYGKPHLEMHWWHAAHFALWNKPELLEKSLGWYRTVSGKAAELAKRQGFRGVRWQKMTDPAGNESPSTVGPFLIWQQPHFLYFAELCYRQNGKTALTRYKDLVFETAEFMASYAWFDPETKRYVLGKALIPAQERFKPETTFNPTFELAYWRWGLSVAQRWRERLGLPRQPAWDAVLAQLSPLPISDGLYLAAESAPDSYSHPPYLTDHPAVLGAFGFLPGGSHLDVPTMARTFDKIDTAWNWEQTWGWDYPLVAMTATRLGLPEKAIEALLRQVTKNTFLRNGHNYQRENLRLYLPGNGGLLAAVALMCAGWDGYHGPPSPGFPRNGTWNVRWEGLSPMP
ncbi:MAG: hypothetical protein H7Y12_10345 [Sphingobacteriaceae bacterium]|nr:hypothetical protein [Cytophagaceae bacterium]